jgi:hypothetical protein
MARRGDVAVFVLGRWKVAFVSLPDECAEDGTKLLRADLYYRGPGAEEMEGFGDMPGGFASPRDSSCCTLAPVGTKRVELQAAVVELVAQLERWWTPAEPWHRSVMALWTWRQYGGGAASDSASWQRCAPPQRSPMLSSVDRGGPPHLAAHAGARDVVAEVEAVLAA